MRGNYKNWKKKGINTMLDNQEKLEMQSESNKTLKRMEDTPMDFTNNENVLPNEKNQFSTNKPLMNLIGVDQSTNNLIEATSEIEVEKIYHCLAKAQESFIATVDEDFFVDNTQASAILDEIDSAKASGAFVPTKHLRLIYGKENTTKIFAKRVAKNGNRGEPVIILVYPDGEVSPELEISMAELMRVSHGNYGETKDGMNKKDVAHADTLIKKIGDRILPYWELDIGINVVELLKMLCASISTLEVDRGEEIDVNMVYSAIYKYIQKSNNYPTKGYLIRKGFYALLSEDILEVASWMNTTSPKIIKILKQYDLLYLQKSSIGNQCEVKGVGSCYCIKMLAKFQPEEVETYSENSYDQL